MSGSAPWAAPLFAAVARSRLPGTAAVRAVEQEIVQLVEAWGKRVERQPFVTNARRLVAPTVLGTGWGWSAVVLAPLLVLPAPGVAVAALGAGALALTALVAYGIAEGYVPVATPAVEVANLMVRNGEQPVVWFVAHSDSKAQAISMRGRLVTGLFLGVGLPSLLALLVARVFGPIPFWAALASATCVVVGSAGLAGSRAQDRSPGAVDNASGIVAALAAFERCRDLPGVGLLITGAEEYGMEGARYWVASDARAGQAFVNFDGIDNEGGFNIVGHREGDVTRRIRAHLTTTLEKEGCWVRGVPLPLGQFVDGAPLARGGLAGITVSRGTMRTLSVVHSPRDTADRTGPESAVLAGRAAADAVAAALG